MTDSVPEKNSPADEHIPPRERSCSAHPPKRPDAGEYYRMLFNSISDAIFVHGFSDDGLPGRFIEVNDIACMRLGYSREELLCMCPLDIDAPETIPNVPAVMDRLRADKQAVWEGVHVAKDGKHIPVEISNTLFEFEGYPTIISVVRDITRRKQTENALLEAKQHFANIIDFLPDATFVIDSEKKVIAWNKAMEEMTGVTKEDMIGQGEHVYTVPFYGVRRPQLLDLLDAEDEELARTYQHVQRKGDRIYAEAFAPALYGGKGAYIWMTGAPLYGINGKRIGAVEAIRDMSELKRAEEVCRESAAKLLSIFKSAPTGIGMVVDRIMTEVNDKLCVMTGYSHDELIGKSVRIFYADDETFAWVGHEKYHQMAEFGTGTVETLWRTKDGRMLNILLSSTPLNPLDIAAGITFIALDITERKRAEEALRKSEEKFSEAFRISPTVLTLSEPDTGRYIEVNDAFTKVFGYSREEVIGKTSIEMGIWISVEDRRALQEVLMPAGEIIGASARMRSKDGKAHDVSISAKLMRYEDRVDLLAIIEDVTEKKKLEAQLIQSQKMESVGRLAGGVAHDFNNMLAVIFFSLALIKNRMRDNDPIMESLIEIEKAAVRSRDITRQLLAFSRKQLIAPKPCDLNALVSELQKSLSRLIGEDIELKVVLQEGLGKVLIDPSQVDQILVNLAVNARDAMPAGGRLTIETANVELDEEYCAMHAEYCRPGKYIRLVVCDTGIGMDKETLAFIFEPFFTTKEIGKGTGLGLATVFGIVKQNNGFVNAYSNPGQGTEFRIYLPRIFVDEISEVPRYDDIPAPGKESILLVEDDDLLQRATKKTLEKLGYSVVAADSPFHAVHLINKGLPEFDLLLTDVVMPGMNGAELRNRVVAARPGIKVLFMSGYTSDSIVQREVLDDGIEFIQKPFSVPAFARKIRDVLDGGAS